MLSAPRAVVGAVYLGGAAALLATRSSAADKEDMVPLEKVPAGVLAAGRKEAPAAVWKVAQKIEEDGETSYEISGVLGKGDAKRLITVEITEGGEVIHVAEMLAKAKVPAKVMDAFTNKFKWTKETYAFEIREDGKVVNYEFATTRPRAATKGKGKKGKAKGKTKEEEITVIVSPNGGSVEIEGEDD
jgi:hypothetical protein